MKKQRPYRLLIADDHPTFCEGIRSSLRDMGKFRIVAECHDGENTLFELSTRKIDIAIIDIDMPVRTGFEVIRMAREGLAIQTSFIIISVSNREEYVKEALSLGVHGYLLKTRTTKELPLCLDAVVRGVRYYSPGLKILEETSPPGSDPKTLPELRNKLDRLTPRQRRIVRFIALGKTSKIIADELSTSKKTISCRTIEDERRHVCHHWDLQGHFALQKFVLEHKTLLLELLPA